MKKHFLLAGFAALMLFACNNKPVSELTLSGLDPAKFQTEVNNAQTNLYTLKNKAGMEVCITNFGGRIVSIMVPDNNGKMQDVVLGFDSIADYINVPSDFGASIGLSLIHIWSFLTSSNESRSGIQPPGVPFVTSTPPINSFNMKF